MKMILIVCLTLVLFSCGRYGEKYVEHRATENNQSIPLTDSINLYDNIYDLEKKGLVMENEEGEWVIPSVTIANVEFSDVSLTLSKEDKVILASYRGPYDLSPEERKAEFDSLYAHFISTYGDPQTIKEEDNSCFVTWKFGDETFGESISLSYNNPKKNDYIVVGSLNIDIKNTAWMTITK